MKIKVTFTEKEIDFLLQCLIARQMRRKDLIEILATDSDLVKNQKNIVKECDRLFTVLYQAEIINRYDK